MERTFAPRDLVMLPILDASGAEVLGGELVSRARDEAIDESLQPVVRQLKRAVAALSRAARARLQPERSAERDPREAYREQASAFGGLHDWLRGLSVLPAESANDPGREPRRIFAVLFGDGLKFLKLPFKAGWIEADRRLRWIQEQELGPVFDELGGLPLLQHARATHQRYGEILGITKTPDPAPNMPSLREPLDAFRAVLRDYVVQVAAMASRGSDTQKQLAARLLDPLSRWPVSASAAPPRAGRAGSARRSVTRRRSRSAESQHPTAPRSIHLERSSGTCKREIQPRRGITANLRALDRSRRGITANLRALDRSRRCSTYRRDGRGRADFRSGGSMQLRWRAGSSSNRQQRWSSRGVRYERVPR
jgi:hypothetical protein